MASTTVIQESDHARFQCVLDKLRREANARFVFLLDRAGQQIASAGDLTGIDPTALASLAAGNVAATEGVALLVGEQGFSTLYHEGQRDSLHINGIGRKAILLVAFDERSSLGLVRLRVQQHSPELTQIADDVHERHAGRDGGPPAAFTDLSEEDIDALFG